MVRVVMMEQEQVRLDEWNEKSMKEHGKDEADGMKLKVDSEDAYRNDQFVILKEEDER